VNVAARYCWTPEQFTDTFELGFEHTPVGELDYGRLAQFNLTGGSISNIALNAAFLATKPEPPLITMEVLFDAIRADFRKLERPINEREFALPSR